MIEIDVRRKAFGTTEILHDINLSIEEGEVLALRGPSGTGKTTLLRILAGLDEDFEGTVVRPEKISMVFQEPTLLPWRSAMENLTLVANISNGAAATALEEVGLGDKKDLFPGQLSLGQQRRLALARAFASEPQLLIMDEPFASLDEARMQDMVELTKKLIKRTDVTTLLVTHSRTEAEALTDKILYLEGEPASLTSYDLT